MKKMLIVLLVLFSFAFVFATEEMRMDLLHYWNQNGIAYRETEIGLLANVVDSGDVKVIIMTDYENIILAFDLSIDSNSIEQFMTSKVLPYSRAFRSDLLDSLVKKMDYYMVFRKHAESVWEQLGQEYVLTHSASNGDLFYFSFY